MDSQKLYFWEQQKEEQKNAQPGMKDPMMEQVMHEEGLQQGLMEPMEQQAPQMQDQAQGAPAVMDKTQEVEKHMPAPIEILSKKQSLLRSGRYTFVTGKGKKAKATRSTPSSKYMKPILDKMEELDRLLDGQFNEKEQDKVQDCFRKIALACEKYLENRKNPWTDEGKARKQMVQDIHAQVKAEAVKFEERVKELEKEPAQKKAGRTWLSVLAEVRTQKYENNVDGVKVTMGGAGMSDIYIVEKDGKKQFFKESEKVPSPSLFTAMEKELERVRDRKDDTGKRRAKYLEDLKKILMEHYQGEKALYKFLEERINKKKDVLAGLCSVLAKNSAFMKIFNEVLLEKAKHDESDTDTDFDFLEHALIKSKKDSLLGGISKNSALIEEGAEVSKRNVATSRMAKLLGLEDMVAKSTMADVLINGKKMQGIMMEEAKGTEIIDVQKKALSQKKKTRYSANAFKQLLNLQVFDIICGQVDRNAGNYLCEHSENTDGSELQITSIKAIDNDVCFGNLKYADIEATALDGLNRMKNVEFLGMMTVPCMDNALCTNILKLTPEMIHYQMCDILDKKEREALIDRIKGVQNVIRRQKKEDEKRRTKDAGATSVFIEEGKENWEKAYENYKKELLKEKEKYRQKAAEMEKQLMKNLEGRASKLTKDQVEAEKKTIREKVVYESRKWEGDIHRRGYLFKDFLAD